MKMDNKEKTDKLQSTIRKNMNTNLLVGWNDTNINDRVKSIINKSKFK